MVWAPWLLSFLYTKSGNNNLTVGQGSVLTVRAWHVMGNHIWEGILHLVVMAINLVPFGI